MANFTRDKYGFWKQDNPQSFVYDEAYERNQHTTDQMCYLRLAFLASHLGYDWMTGADTIDIGPGNGLFHQACKRVFRTAEVFRVDDDPELLQKRNWDLATMTDVAEHLPDLSFMLSFRWQYLLVSIPETPHVAAHGDLKQWRHYKPDEHIWMLNAHGLRLWFKERNCRCVAMGCPEDLIRTRWDPALPNISSLLIVRGRS